MVNWLVVSTPLKHIKVSWNDDIPNIWKVIKFHGSKPPTSQNLHEKCVGFHHNNISAQEDESRCFFMLVGMMQESSSVFPHLPGEGC